jgi:hypothetical protein
MLKFQWSMQRNASLQRQNAAKVCKGQERTVPKWHWYRVEVCKYATDCASVSSKMLFEGGHSNGSFLHKASATNIARNRKSCCANNKQSSNEQQFW